MTPRIHPTALIEEDVKIGSGTAIWDHAHVRHDARTRRPATGHEPNRIVRIVRDREGLQTDVPDPEGRPGREHVPRRSIHPADTVDGLNGSGVGVERHAVATLEPALQETVALHYFQGLSLREVGAVMEVPAGTVKSRVNRALGQLRERLDKKEAEHGTERAGKALARNS